MFAPAKGDRREMGRGEATELGVDTIVPWSWSDRSWRGPVIARRISSSALRRISRERPWSPTVPPARGSGRCRSPTQPHVAGPASAHPGGAAPPTSSAATGPRRARRLVGSTPSSPSTRPGSVWPLSAAGGRPPQSRPGSSSPLSDSAVDGHVGCRSRRERLRTVIRHRYGDEGTRAGAGQGEPGGEAGRPMNDERLSDDEPQSTAYGRRWASASGASDARSDCRSKMSRRTPHKSSRRPRSAHTSEANVPISVPRLQRLARLRTCPVDQLLPPDQGPEFELRRRHRPHRRRAERLREARDRLRPGSMRSEDPTWRCSPVTSR